MSAFNRILQATLLLALSTLLLQGPVLAGPPADAVPVDITGELTVMYMDDFKNKRAELQVFIEDKQTNRQYRLQFDGTPPGHLRSGATVKVRGKAKGKDIFLAADGTGDQGIETISSATVIVAGEQKTLVIGVNLTDRNLNCSIADINDLVFTDVTNQSVDDLYQETSFGNVWLSGQAVGNYNINYATTDPCDIVAWGNAAEAAALADGINVSAYPRKVYVLPPNSCPASGYGTVGGSSSRSWVFTCDLPDVFAHELGHNLGMQHAATPSYTYGDTSDIMGLGGGPLRHVNAPHKEQLGWLSDAPAQLVTASGTYDIAPLEFDPATALAPRALKIFKADSNEYYFVSFRRPVGFDSNLASKYLDRLSIHRHAGNGSSGTTYLLANLADGESFTDTTNGITITQVSHGSSYATASVSLDGSNPPPTCTAGTPLVSISPASQSASAGTMLTYTVSVANTDSSACPDSSFVLGNSTPTGWTGTLSKSSLGLAPGQTGSATYWVTSAAGAIASTYSVSVNVSGSASVHTASGSASYSVVTSCTRAVPGLTLSPGSQSGDPGATLSYNITLTNNDSSSCGSSTFDLAYSLLGGLTGNLSQPNLSLSPGSQGSAILYVSSSQETAAGSHSILISASDTATTAHDATRTGTYIVNETTQAGDTEAPSPPSGLTASSKPNQINLFWNDSTDNVGVTGYKVWRDNVLLSATLNTSYIDRAATSDVTYTYFIEAYDAADNISAPSNSVSVGKAKAKAKGKGRSR